jgi:hypothetical protein
VAYFQLPVRQTGPHLNFAGLEKPRGKENERWGIRFTKLLLLLFPPPSRVLASLSGCRRRATADDNDSTSAKKELPGHEEKLCRSNGPSPCYRIVV